MKFFLSIILILCGIAKTHAQELDQYELDDIQNKIFKIDSIKQLLVYEYKPTKHGKQPDSTLLYRIIYRYGDNGSINAFYESMDKKAPLSFTYSSIFNENGDILKRNFKSIKPTNRGFGLVYNYNELGKESEMIAYNTDTTRVATLKSEYNTAGICVRTMMRLPEENSFSIYDSLFYDSEGRLNEQRRYDGRNKPFVSFFYDYEINNGEKTVTVVKQANGTQHIISKNKYNNLGQVVQSMDSPFSNPFESHREELTIQKFYYNEDGTANTSISYFNGRAEYILKYHYTRQ